MKMIWTLPFRYFRVGTHIEDDRSDHVGTYRGIRAAR